MKTITYSFLALLFIASLIGCKEHPNKAYISKIDTLNSKVLMAEKKLIEIDIVNIDSVISEVKREFDYIHEHADTVEKPAAFILSDYYASQRSLGKMKKQYLSTLKEIEYSKKQLETLRHDADYNKVTGKALEEYFNTEAEAVSRVMETVANIEIWKHSGLARRDKLKPKVDSLMSLLK